MIPRGSTEERFEAEAGRCKRIMTRIGAGRMDAADFRLLNLAYVVSNNHLPSIMNVGETVRTFPDVKLRGNVLIGSCIIMESPEIPAFVMDMAAHFAQKCENDQFLRVICSDEPGYPSFPGLPPEEPHTPCYFLKFTESVDVTIYCICGNHDKHRNVPRPRFFHRPLQGKEHVRPVRPWILTSDSHVPAVGPGWYLGPRGVLPAEPPVRTDEEVFDPYDWSSADPSSPAVDDASDVSDPDVPPDAYDSLTDEERVSDGL